MNTQNSDPGQDPNSNLNEDGAISYKTRPQCHEDVQPLPEAMVVALGAFKDRKTSGPIAYALVEDAQPLSATLVAALTIILPECRGANAKNGAKTSSSSPPGVEKPGFSCLDMCLNAGSAFVVRGVERGENAHVDSQEIWTIEDVVSNQLSIFQPPRGALLPDNTDLNALLNTGVIPILEQTPDGPGLTKYRFSLASLADGRKTPLYGWAWFTFPTFS